MKPSLALTKTELDSIKMSERPRRIPLADYKIFRKITTRWMDNDSYGHMNNVVHYSLFDTAVTGWLVDQGGHFTRGSHQKSLVVETGCTYLAEMAFPDVINTAIRVSKLGSSSVRYDIGLFRNDETEPSAQGFFVHVYVNAKTHKPEPIAPDLRRALERISIENK